MEQLQVKLAENSPLGRQGQLVTLSLTPTDVNIPEELPSYLAGYKPNGFRADEVSNVVLVDKDSGFRRDFSSNDAFRRVDVKGSIDGAIPEVDPQSATTQYTVVDRFIGSFINDITQGNAVYDVQQRAMRRCSWAVALDREIDVWTLMTTLGNWAAANRVTLGASFQWGGPSGAGANSDPIADLHARIEASLQEVTDIWMNQAVANAFLRHPLVRDHMRQMNGDQAADAAVGMVKEASSKNVDFKIIGLPPIHVSAAKVRNEATAAHDYVLNDTCVLVTVPPGGAPRDGEEIATTYTFRRRGGAGVGFETREYRVDNRGPKGGTMVVVSMADIAQMVANNVGGAIFDVLQ
jgi:hypothetical protein